MINIAQDSDGTTFQLWQQTQLNSCCVASTWMARGLVRQMSFSEEEWALAQRFYRNAVNNMLAPLGVDPSGPMTLDPRAFAANQNTMASTLARVGFFPDQLVAALRSEGFNVNHVVLPSNGVLAPGFLNGQKCGIVLVFWNGGGGHAIVAARQASNGRIVFLDPGDGQINEQPNNGVYNARYGGTGRIAQVIYLS